MSFCANCGRPRNGTARFCGGCGFDFEPAGTAETREPPAADGASPETMLDVDPGVTRVETPASQTDPFASWYQRETPAAGQDSDGNWQPTQTVQAAPTQAAGHLTPSYPPPVPPPGPAAAPPPARGGGGRWLFVTVAIIVVIAAGGGAYALASSLGQHHDNQPTGNASPPATGTTPPASASGSGAASSPAPSPSPTPSPTLSLVAISPDVRAGTAGGTVPPQVEELLSHYFHGINTHDYQEYASTLSASQLAKQPQSQFESGYSSTTDSDMKLTSLAGSGSGGLTATVTFTSRQAPAQSVDKSACNAWTLNLYLVPQGTGYLIGPAPSGYQPTYSDCLC